MTGPLPCGQCHSRTPACRYNIACSQLPGSSSRSKARAVGKPRSDTSGASSLSCLNSTKRINRFSEMRSTPKQCPPRGIARTSYNPRRTSYVVEVSNKATRIVRKMRIVVLPDIQLQATLLSPLDGAPCLLQEADIELGFALTQNHARCRRRNLNATRRRSATSYQWRR